MSKELFVSSTPHETKVAIVEDDLLSEIYFERENEYTLAGSIYKGRVTRVLPGMQSAFVDIGLERDAFLYVSDFLEHAEEEDEDFEQLPIPAQGAQGSFGRGNGSVAEEAEEEVGAETVDTAQQSGGGDTETEPEPRRWRGRRSRRRGRGGLPESKFVSEAGAAQEPSEAVESSPHGPIVLAGESLAKYGQSAEQDTQKKIQADESSESLPSSHEKLAAPMAEPSAKKSPGIAGWDGGLTLPGESISKYRPRDENSAAASESPTQERKFTSESRRSFDRRRPERQSERVPSGPPILALPGESISKYKGSALETQPSATMETEEQRRSTTSAETSETPVSHDSEVSSKASVAPSDSFFTTENDAEERPVHAEDVHPETHSQRWEIGQAPEQVEKPEEQPFGATVESEFTAPPEAEIHAEPGSATEQESATSSQVFAPGAGHIEEEIIEEEEIEPELLVESYEDSLYDELEEETIEADGGEEITEAVRDSHVEERTGPGYVEYEGEAPEPVEAAETEVESESSEDDPGSEGEDEEFADRAEVRAPAATAGFQQRAERSAPAERRRGRGRFQKRRVHARRNIQRSSMPTISELLKEGQEILVQIAKEPIAKKGARITSHIALPGRFLVYMPTVNHVGVSRKIGSDEERQRLKRILISEKGNAHGGFIVRTAASGANEEELRADIRFLINLWTEIKSRSDSGKAPALIYHDLNLVERVLRDLVNTTFSSVWVDTEQEYERIVRFLNRFQPSLLKKVKLYSKETPLFEQFGIQDEINKALKSKVWLKSGGYIVINQTEALVAIDINTGKFVGKTARLEDTIVKTNLDAIKEIVRQIRLRDLGGIIVIDFIDMDERKNRQKVMQGLEDALRGDRAPSKVLQFNDFGLVAITRKRVKQSLERTLGAPCTYCTGTGMIKSVQTICNEIYVEMRKMAKHLEHHDVMLRVHPEVVKGLKEKGGRWLQEMEELIGKTIIVKSDPTLHQEQFDIN
jgi:ribonuclease E